MVRENLWDSSARAVRPYQSMVVPPDFRVALRLTVGGSFEQLLGNFEKFSSDCKILNIRSLGAYFRPFLRC